MSGMKIKRRWWDPVYRYEVDWPNAYKLHKTQKGVSSSGKVYPIQGPFYVMRAGVQHFIEALPTVRRLFKERPAVKYQYRTGRLKPFTITEDERFIDTTVKPPVLLMARKGDALMLKLACAGN